MSEFAYSVTNLKYPDSPLKANVDSKTIKKGIGISTNPFQSSLNTYKLSIAFCTAGPIWRLREVTPSRVNMSLVGSALKADLITW